MLCKWQWILDYQETLWAASKKKTTKLLLGAGQHHRYRYRVLVYIEVKPQLESKDTAVIEIMVSNTKLFLLWPCASWSTGKGFWFFAHLEYILKASKANIENISGAPLHLTFAGSAFKFEWSLNYNHFSLIVLTSACESNPCVNNGYCSSDLAVDPSQYKCACSAWFTGKNCEGENRLFYLNKRSS